MEQEHRSPYLYRAVWLGVAILFLVLLLTGLTVPGKGKPFAPPIIVGFSLPRSGHMGNFYSGHFVVAFVTNATPWNIDLLNPVLQWDKNGAIVTDYAPQWGGTNEFCSLGTNGVMPLPFEIPTNATKFRISFFEYSHEAGPFQKMLSPAASILLPRRTIPWRTYRQGWLDGREHMNYEGEWRTNR